MEQAIILTLLGMGTVLAVLYIINVMIIVIGKLLGKENKASHSTPAPIASPKAVAAVAGSTGNVEEEMVAAAIAAVAIFTEAHTMGINVKPYTTSSAWGAASRADNTK